MEYFQFNWVRMDGDSNAKILASIDRYELERRDSSLYFIVYIKDFLYIDKTPLDKYAPAFCDLEAKKISVQTNRGWFENHQDITLEEFIKDLKASGLNMLLEFDDDDLAKLWWEVR